jgi:hypothetical protein
MRPMLLSSVVDVQGPAALRSPRVNAARQATGTTGAVNRAAPWPSWGRGSALSARVRSAVRRNRPAMSEASNSAGAKGTSTSRVPLPIGMSVSRVRSSTGIVMRNGRGRAPCSRFQWAIIRAVATMSWSFTVYGEPLGRRGTPNSATSMPLPGEGSGAPCATRAGGAQEEGASTALGTSAVVRVGGAAGELSRPPYSSAAVARTRRQAGPSRAVWLMVTKRTVSSASGSRTTSRRIGGDADSGGASWSARSRACFRASRSGGGNRTTSTSASGVSSHSYRRPYQGLRASRIRMRGWRCRAPVNALRSRSGSRRPGRCTSMWTVSGSSSWRQCRATSSTTGNGMRAGGRTGPSVPSRAGWSSVVMCVRLPPSPRVVPAWRPPVVSP